MLLLLKGIQCPWQSTQNKPPDKVKSQTTSVKSFTKELLDFSLYKNTKWVIFCIAYILLPGSIQAFLSHSPSRMVHMKLLGYQLFHTLAIHWPGSSYNLWPTCFQACGGLPFSPLAQYWECQLQWFLSLKELGGGNKGAFVGAAPCGVNIGVYNIT